MKEAVVLLGGSGASSEQDVLWRTGFKMSDEGVFIEINDSAYLMVCPLEVDRAKKEARNVSVIDIQKYSERLSIAEGVRAFLEEQNVTDIVTSEMAPFYLCKMFCDEGWGLRTADNPFYSERKTKSEREIAEIYKAQWAAEKAFAKAFGYLKNCTLKGNEIHGPNGVVTSELLRSIIEVSLLKDGYDTPEGTIVSSGSDSVFPHVYGSGPIQPYVPLIIDIFPRSKKTGYWGDITRTVFVGTPSQELRKMYEIVFRAQSLALSALRPGADGHDIWKNTARYFKQLGYVTDETVTPNRGFIHGVGHSVGLELHERPVITRRHDVLEAGNVVTVEPGLYYPELGGIRIEDTVVVTENGYQNLTCAPKRFKDMVIRITEQ